MNLGGYQCDCAPTWVFPLMSFGFGVAAVLRIRLMLLSRCRSCPMCLITCPCHNPLLKLTRHDEGSVQDGDKSVHLRDLISLAERRAGEHSVGHDRSACLAFCQSPQQKGPCDEWQHCASRLYRCLCDRLRPHRVVGFVIVCK